LTEKTWTDGDFNYDGSVDFADLTTLSQNYGQTPLTSAQRGILPTIAGPEFAADFLLAQSLVPEPASFDGHRRICAARRSRNASA
jgi:hypothetical protein